MNDEIMKNEIDLDEQIKELQIQLSNEKKQSQKYKQIIDKFTPILLYIKDNVNLDLLLSEIKDENTSTKHENIIIKKKPLYKPFKTVDFVIEDDDEIIKNNIDTDTESILQQPNISNDIINLNEAKIIFEDIINKITLREKTYNELLKSLKETRMKIISKIHIDEYINILKEHTKRLKNIFLEKQLSEKNIIRNVKNSLSSIDMRLLSYSSYTNTVLLMDDLCKFRDGLKVSTISTPNLIPFVHEDLYKSFFNYGLCVCSVKECIKRNIINSFGKNNVVYIPLPKSKETDSFSFYYLKKIEKNKKFWNMDCRLEELSNRFVDNIKPFLIDLFRRIYSDCFSDNDYRVDFLDSDKYNHKIHLDLKQLIQNILVLSNPKKFNKFILRPIIKEDSVYIPKSEDVQNHTADDSMNRRRFENNKEDIDPIETVLELFDNISTQEAVDLYRLENVDNLYK